MRLHSGLSRRASTEAVEVCETHMQRVRTPTRRVRNPRWRFRCATPQPHEANDGSRSATVLLLIAAVLSSEYELNSDRT